MAELLWNERCAVLSRPRTRVIECTARRQEVNGWKEVATCVANSSSVKPRQSPEFDASSGGSLVRCFVKIPKVERAAMSVERADGRGLDYKSSWRKPIWIGRGAAHPAVTGPRVD